MMNEFRTQWQIVCVKWKHEDSFGMSLSGDGRTIRSIAIRKCAESFFRDRKAFN